MKGPRLLIALVVAGALLVPAYAHRPPAPNFPRSAGFVQAAEYSIRGFTLDEVIAWSDAQFAKRVAWGSFVRYAGTAIFASSLIYAGLEWFYDQAKQSTGTSLDSWWNMAGGPYSDWMWVITGGYCDDYFHAYIWTYVCPNCQSREVGGGSCPPTPALSVGEQAILNREGTLADYQWVDSDQLGGPVQVIPAGGGQPWTVGAAYVRIGRPPLPDWIQAHPDAADGIKQALTNYIKNQDSQNNIPQTFGQPIPGVTLDPEPTGNQWWDNPFFDPMEDTDQDGWPDWFEWDTGSNPSNAGSQPLPTADPDGDGYDNASERDAGTDPTDPNSRPDVDQDQDSDGDGLKDSADPCPNDPLNQCQPDNNEQTPEPETPTLTPVDIPSFEMPTMPDVASRFDPLKQNFQQRLDDLWDVLQDRFPVGMSRWIPVPPSVSGGSCDMSITLQIPDLPSAQVDICDNPVMQWAATTGRQLVLVSLMVGFLFAVARRASGA
ncbi:thrombospondin type 3 repeat-containing protein [Oceanithermus sp.]